MKTVKLSCASCGAPITIPEGVDTVICPSCQSTLAVDRGEGYVTLKLVEKLTNSLQETTSAIKENAYVTQVELRRMQINQSISMEEMKLHSLQSEIRAAKRGGQANNVNNPELMDLLLQENDIRMRIRSLAADAAHLDPGWEESLEVIRRDGQLIDQAIQCLAPYKEAIPILNRLAKMHEEQRRNVAAYEALEIKLLRREIVSLGYPPFSQLSLTQMEELMKVIPGDLIRLEAGEQTAVKIRVHKDLKEKLEKVKAVYPRRKVEEEAGPLPSLDYVEPYPEAPERLRPMIDQVRFDLGKLAVASDSPEKRRFTRELESKLADLTARAEKNIPAAKVRKRKRKAKTVVLSILFVILSFVVLIVVVAVSGRGGTEDRDQARDTNISESSAETEAQVDSPAPGSVGEAYSAAYVEVIASTTFLRENPSLDAPGSYRVDQGDILVDISDSSVPDQWYYVMTWDGTETGYLAIDWVMPFSVKTVQGESLPATYSRLLTGVDFNDWDNLWPERTFDDEFSVSRFEYADDTYVLTSTASQDYIYTYGNQPVADLPEDYLYSLKIRKDADSGNVSYGIQFNIVDDANFDAMLISNDGKLKVLYVRNGSFRLLYDESLAVSGVTTFDPYQWNTFSVVRHLKPLASGEQYQYAINGQVIAEINLEKAIRKGTSMGVMVYLGNQGDSASVRIDDFSLYY